MLHDSYPVVDLLGQISRSNAGSKLSVKIVGRICWVKLLVESVRRIAGRIHGSNSLVELLDQMRRSNSWIKSAGQIARPCNVRRYIRNVARYVKRSQSNAANPWPAAGQPRRTHGHACGQAENSLGRAGNGQRKRPRCEAWPVMGCLSA